MRSVTLWGAFWKSVRNEDFLRQELFNIGLHTELEKLSLEICYLTMFLLRRSTITKGGTSGQAREVYACIPEMHGICNKMS